MTKQYSRPSANILLEAAELQEKKGADYNNATSSVEQADYYPRGVWSILDVVNAKYLRMVSVLETMEQGGKVNFESIEDSAIDLINYASFVAAYMRGDVPGQKPNHDVFNRPVTKSTQIGLVPSKFKQDPNTVTVSVEQNIPNFVTGFSVFNQENGDFKVSQYDVYDMSMKKEVK